MQSKFDELLRLAENMMAGGIGSVFGPAATGEHGGQVGNTDWYAPGDARIPKVIGIGAKSKKGCKKCKNKNMIPVVKRSIYSGL